MPRKPIKPPPLNNVFHCSTRTKLLFFSMASALLLTLLFLALYLSLSSAAHHQHNRHKSPTLTADPSTKIIQSACNATRFPETCAAALTQSSSNLSTPLEILKAAISISTQNLKTAQTKAKHILDSSANNPNRSSAAQTCIEILRNADLRQSSAAEALHHRRNKDARAWLSASLCFQYDCWSGLKYVNDSQMVNETMAFMGSLTALTSNALSMAVSYDLFGDNVGLWRPPATERSGFWEEGGGGSGGGGGGGGEAERGFKGGIPVDLAVNVTVSKGGCGGCYRTVQEAVDAAPENGERKFVVRIKEGVYEETVRVPLEKRNVVFLGDGMGKTVITGSSKVGLGVTTYDTATVGK